MSKEISHKDNTLEATAQALMVIGPHPTFTLQLPSASLPLSPVPGTHKKEARIVSLSPAPPTFQTAELRLLRASHMLVRSN